MSRGDRCFARLLAMAVASGLVLVLPLAITLFPGELQRALHGYDALVEACASALYRLGATLPPLGAIVLALTVATLGVAALRTWQVIRRTERVLERHQTVPPPPRLRVAAAAVGVVDRIACVQDARAYAYCAGLLHPRIWVSTGAARRLRRRELEAVLWHETHHLRRRDPLRVLVARALASALFALPAIGALQRRFEVAKELDADQAALRAQGSASALAGALLKLAQEKLPFAPQQVAAGAWSLSSARVEQLCGADPEAVLPAPSSRARWLSALALAGALLLASGQAARANLLPASALDQLGFAPFGASVHECPLPRQGILL